MASFTSYNPRTGGVVGTYPVASDDDAACAVERLREWGEIRSHRTHKERASALRTLRDSIADDVDGLADVICAEIGKPRQEAIGAELLSLVGALDWLANHTPDLLKLRRIPGERNAHLQAMPYGVVGVIGTWNYPLLLDGMSVAWAVAAGNGVVWKPSELATASATALYQHFERAGLPVVMITGDGAAGYALCKSQIDKLAFTGGVVTGRKIQAQLAERGIPSVMELSGNDAMLVCRDADVPAAARAAVWARVCNAGQSCVSPQRIFVDDSVYESFVQACQRNIAELRAGVDYGPMRTDGLRLRVRELVDEAVSQGAKLLAGGRSLSEAPFADGFYYAPTLLTDCDPDMAIMQEDFFGPVLCVSWVPEQETARCLANRTEMGLGVSVWTRNVRNGQYLAHSLKAGVVTINSETLLTGAHPGLPFGGMGASGWGRQRGAAGLDEFVQWKTVCWQHSAGAQRHVFPYRDATLPILRGMIALKTAHGVTAKMQAVRQLAEAARNWNNKPPKS
jgi:acyl-CoA reductase-like NAD-dependent aldehyde dehydrogenase